MSPRDAANRRQHLAAERDRILARNRIIAAATYLVAVSLITVTLIGGCVGMAMDATAPPAWADPCGDLPPIIGPDDIGGDC